MIKTLYVVFSKWKKDRVPTVIWNCAKSWIARNDDWEVVLISQDNVHHYITDSFLEQIKHLTDEQKIDLIRLRLIYENGGMCVDAKTFCLKSVDTWFNENMIVDDTYLIVPNLIYVKENFDRNVADMSLLYSDIKYNTVFDPTEFINSPDIFQSFNDNIDSDLLDRLILAAPDMHRYNKYGDLLATGVFQLSDQRLAASAITQRFLNKLNERIYPFFKLSLDVTIKNKRHEKLTDKQINMLSIEEHYGKNSKLNFMYSVLQNEIRNNT